MGDEKTSTVFAVELQCIRLAPSTALDDAGEGSRLPTTVARVFAISTGTHGHTD